MTVSCAFSDYTPYGGTINGQDPLNDGSGAPC